MGELGDKEGLGKTIMERKKREENYERKEKLKKGNRGRIGAR